MSQCASALSNDSCGSRKVRASLYKNDVASTNVRSSVMGGFSSKIDSSASQGPFLNLSKRTRNERHHRLKEMYTSSSLRQNYFQKNGRLKSRPKEVEIDTVDMEQKLVGNCQFLNIMEPMSSKKRKSKR